MDDMRDAIGGTLMGFGGLLLFGAFVLIMGWQAAVFLSDGDWHAFTLAEIIARAGYDPNEVLDPAAQWNGRSRKDSKLGVFHDVSTDSH